MIQQPITFNEVPEAIYQTREEVRELKRIVQTHLVDSINSRTVYADELLTPEQTAEILKVSKVTVWQWSKPNPGILNPRRIGNQVRYLRSEVMAAARPKRGVVA